MSTFIPTTTVTVQRGFSLDSYGDQVDSGQARATGIPAAISELRQRSHLPAEQRGGVSEQFLIRLRPGVDVAEQDRLLDERTSAYYLVTSISQAPAVVGQADIRATATRVGAQSTS